VVEKTVADLEAGPPYAKSTQTTRMIKMKANVVFDVKDSHGCDGSYTLLQFNRIQDNDEKKIDKGACPLMDDLFNQAEEYSGMMVYTNNPIVFGWPERRHSFFKFHHFDTEEILEFLDGEFIIPVEVSSEFFSSTFRKVVNCKCTCGCGKIIHKRGTEWDLYFCEKCEEHALPPKPTIRGPVCFRCSGSGRMDVKMIGQTIGRGCDHCHGSGSGEYYRAEREYVIYNVPFGKTLDEYLEERKENEEDSADGSPALGEDDSNQ
jgi:hypothetical protein